MRERRTLLAVLVDRDDHTLIEIIKEFDRCARSSGEDATLSVRTLRRWMSGDLRTEPRPSQRRVAQKFWGLPVAQLLAPPPEMLVEVTRCGRRVGVGDGSEQVTSTSVGPGDLGTPAAWPEWFGLRMPHLLAIIDNWRGSGVEVQLLQQLLHQEILMFDAISPDDGDWTYSVSRRQALITIAALPITFSAGVIGQAGAVDFFISRCAASLTACWHLLRGSDLSVVDRMVSPYLLELERIAQQQSVHQHAAARLASQAHRISGIVALHRDQLRRREYHCRLALRYAEHAGDASSRVSALVSLASTYFYDATPLRAVGVFERALAFGENMSPLQRSRVHAELAVVYGQLGREQDALRSCALAEELYPEFPEQDSSFLYAEFTRASLTLERGMAHMALADQYPGRNYQHAAAEIFGQMEKSSPATVPDRIRYEITNHQATVAVLLGDLDAFEGHVDRAAEGVVQLDSIQRQKEVRDAWRRANLKWKGEPRLEAVGHRIKPLLKTSVQSVDVSFGWKR